MKFAGPPPKSLKLSKDAENWLQRLFKGQIKEIRTKRLYGFALSSDPDDPPAGGWVMWQSDGTGSGADGDLMVKVTDTGGTTKTTTLVDFSAI
jgi:hypothetical protein